MALPLDIKQFFFDTLNGDKSVLEFEQWLYANTQLESVLDAGDYLDLISYGYKQPDAKYGLFKLLEKHIEKGEFEKSRILRLLTKALNKDKELPQILMTFYDLYCKGYQFLDNLGLAYGLAVEVPRVKNTTAESWEELTAKQQEDLLQSFYPGIESELKKVISWVVTGKVILTGVQNNYDHFEYIDNRTELEKMPTAYGLIVIPNTISSSK
jgi:hypothetical protein